MSEKDSSRNIISEVVMIFLRPSFLFVNPLVIFEQIIPTVMPSTSSNINYIIQETNDREEGLSMETVAVAIAPSLSMTTVETLYQHFETFSWETSHEIPYVSYIVLEDLFESHSLNDKRMKETREEKKKKQKKNTIMVCELLRQSDESKVGQSEPRVENVVETSDWTNYRRFTTTMSRNICEL